MQAATSEDSSTLQATRRQIAAQHTWQQRVEVLSAAIEHRLEELRSVHAANRILEGEVQTSGF